MFRRLIALALLLVSGAGFAQQPQPYRWDASLAGFNVGQFLLEQRPRYLAYAEAISHYGGYFSSHPLAIVALMDMDGGLENAATNPSAILKSFDSAPKVDDRIRAVALALSDLEKSDLENVVQDIERSKSSGPGFGQRFARLKQLARLPVVRADKGAIPAFQLPTPQGQAWQFSGVHSNQGLDDGSPMSAIDLAGNWFNVWGNDVSTYKVSSSHDGVATVLSTCFVLITHDSGWMTGYYHLDNIRVQTGQRVRAGQLLAEYANSLDQALCLGGHSQGPHQHFSLRFDGTHIALDQRVLSGYQVHAGNFDYDSHPTRMYLQKNQTRYYAFQSQIVNEVPSGVRGIDHSYSGMWYQPTLSGHGLNLVVDEGDTSLTVFVTFFTYDDNGLANFYAGNVAVESWVLDQPLTLPMLQTRNGGFTTPSAVDTATDAQVAGVLTLTLSDCASGMLAFELDERAGGERVANEFPVERLLGSPGCVDGR